MEVYIARQPIFDRRQSIYGYELLYRNDIQNYFPVIDDNQATVELIYNSFLVMGLKNLTEGTKAFINFSKELIDSDVAMLLPKGDIVVEVLERGEVSAKTEEACRQMNEIGYIIALDDVVFDENTMKLMEYASIIKIEFNIMPKEDQVRLINKYRKKIKFLAEKVETREEYQMAMEMGYDYFQGYFFSKPTMIHKNDIVAINSNIFEILKELNYKDPNYVVVANIIQRDLGLTYKLLMLTNTIKFGAKNQIRSVKHALSYLGINELYQWISLIMLKDMKNSENSELIKLSIIRGKLMEEIAHALHLDEEESEYFLVGIFSFIDVILNKNMQEALADIPLADKIKQSILDRHTPVGKMLDFVIAYENADWDLIVNQYPINEIGEKEFLRMYVDALKWTTTMNY